MFPGLLNHLLGRLFPPHQYHRCNARNDGGAYHLDIAEACQQHDAARLSGEHVAHQIACGACLDRYVQLVLSDKEFGTQQAFDIG